VLPCRPMKPEDTIATLQRYVDAYTSDIAAAQAALGDESLPVPARRLVVGALNYVLDSLDMFPDHYKGLGVADDAMVLRLGAAQAVAAGAQNPDLARLGADAAEIRAMLPDLADALDKFVAALGERTVRGRTVDQIIDSKDVRVMFEGDLGREIKRHQPSQIEVGSLGAQAVVKEMEKMLRSGLKKAGIG